MVPLRGLMTQQKAGSPPLWAVRGENEAQTWPTSTQRLRVTTARQQTALLGREGPRAITFPCGLHGLSVAFRAQACTQSCLTLCDPVTVALQAPLTMGFPRQGSWSRLLFPPPGDLPDPWKMVCTHPKPGEQDPSGREWAV